MTQIAEVTKDQATYDAREKAICGQQWALNASRNEGLIEGEIKGKIEGKIEMIPMPQEILQVPVSAASNFEGKSLAELHNLTIDFQERI